MEEDELDPRIQVELEKLNTATDEINRLEIELDEANTTFRMLLGECTRRLKVHSGRHGSAIVSARPYYEALDGARAAQRECQAAAVAFQRANEIHEAAKETVALAETRFLSQPDWRFDAAWQDMLNHATLKVRDAEKNRAESATRHGAATARYKEAQDKVQSLEQRLKRSVAKSRPYFEEKARCNDQLSAQKDVVESLQRCVAETKRGYANSLRRLEGISEEIHRKRAHMLEACPGIREPGVGAELEYRAELDRCDVQSESGVALAGPSRAHDGQWECSGERMEAETLVEGGAKGASPQIKRAVIVTTKDLVAAGTSFKPTEAMTPTELTDDFRRAQIGASHSREPPETKHSELENSRSHLSDAAGASESTDSEIGSSVEQTLEGSKENEGVSLHGSLVAKVLQSDSAKVEDANASADSKNSFLFGQIPEGFKEVKGERLENSVVNVSRSDSGKIEDRNESLDSKGSCSLSSDLDCAKPKDFNEIKDVGLEDTILSETAGDAKLDKAKESIVKTCKDSRSGSSKNVESNAAGDYETEPLSETNSRETVSHEVDTQEKQIEIEDSKHKYYSGEGDADKARPSDSRRDSNLKESRRDSDDGSSIAVDAADEIEEPRPNEGTDDDVNENVNQAVNEGSNEDVKGAFNEGAYEDVNGGASIAQNGGEGVEMKTIEGEDNNI